MATEIKEGLRLSIVDVVGSTGLQIKADPGIPIVYFGFALLMAGVVMSYFSHSQIWAVIKDGKLYLGGRTNRAQVTFERQTIEIIDRLQSATTGQLSSDAIVPTSMPISKV
jgi:cytochrome c biogenesis protein